MLAKQSKTSFHHRSVEERKPANLIYQEALDKLKEAVIPGMKIYYRNNRWYKITTSDGVFLAYLEKGKIKLILDKSITLKCYSGTVDQFIKRFSL